MLITNNWRLWIIGPVLSLAIFLIVYFTVIRPDNSAANAALRTGEAQSQQVIKQASSAAQAAGGSSAAVNKALSKAQKLASCVTAAGTDTTKLAACQAQYGA
jgi:hypothetical protein